MIINNENLFLIGLGLIWIISAVIEDFKKREVDNIWNFSLIGFALAYRASISVYSGDYWFILNGLLGLAVFLFLGNVFYYSRIFAGGDAKLLIALGTILPLSYSWMVNFKIFAAFVVLFLVLGSVYALIWSFFLVVSNFKNFKKEINKQFKLNKKLFFACLGFIILWSLFVIIINEPVLLLISVVVLLFPLLFIFSKAVEESCMVKAVFPSKLTEGDWLYEDIVVNGKKIKADWEGVSASELSFIRSNYRKKILIKQGIPFTPSFLLAFIGVLFVVWKFGWWF